MRPIQVRYSGLRLPEEWTFNGGGSHAQFEAVRTIANRPNFDFFCHQNPFVEMVGAQTSRLFVVLWYDTEDRLHLMKIDSSGLIEVEYMVGSDGKAQRQ